MKLLTRRELIEIWQQRSSEKLDMYCCPYCRDILYEEEYRFVCTNPKCKCVHVLKRHISN